MKCVWAEVSTVDVVVVVVVFVGDGVVGAKQVIASTCGVVMGLIVGGNNGNLAWGSICTLEGFCSVGEVRILVNIVSFAFLFCVLFFHTFLK